MPELLIYLAIGLINTVFSFCIAISSRFILGLSDSSSFVSSILIGSVSSWILNSLLTFKALFTLRNAIAFTLCTIFSLGCAFAGNVFMSSLYVDFVFNQIASMALYSIMHYSLLKRFLKS